MSTPLFEVVVPATTANLGPGYDCFGMALDLTMTITVYPSLRWEVIYLEEEYQTLPSDESNLIVQTIQKTAQDQGKCVEPLRLVITSNIPLGKGLGSSASAIAGGIVIADTLLSLDLSMDQKLALGTAFEGHADNVNAALYGGFVCSYYHEGQLEFVALPAPKVGVLLLVPDAILATSESRQVIPTTLQHTEATASSAAGHLLVAAMATENWGMVGRMLEKDAFHEPFRKAMFPSFEEIRVAVKKAGAYGLTISGAGPSLFLIAPDNRLSEVSDIIRKEFPMYHPVATKPIAEGTYVNLFKNE